MKTTKILFLVTLACMAVAGGQNAHARTVVVHSIADDGPGSLREALVVASNGDTINITAKGTITLTSGELVVAKSVTIRGPGPHGTVSGNGASRVFHITPNTIVTISGLTITNGNVASAVSFPANAGGGIYSDHAKLTVSSCVLSGNSATYGGGIFSNAKDGGSAILMVSNTTLSNNSAVYGGGIFSGGGFFNTGSSGSANLTLTNCILTRNSANYGAGAGIFNDGFSGTATLTLNNSTVSENSISDFVSTGGGIYNNGDSGVATVTLTNSTVTGNSPDVGYGSGIYNDGTSTIGPGSATLTLTDSAVSGNPSEFGSGKGIVNNSNSGSAIVTLNNSTVSGHSGRGFENVGGGSSATLNSSTVSGNSGGGIYNGLATLTLNNSTVKENSATDGVIVNSLGAVTLNNSIVSGNSGAGIVNDCATLTLNNSTVGDNSADYNGNGIENYCEHGAISTATLTDSTVKNNSHDGINNYGAGGGSATFTLTNSTVSGNSGYGIYTSGVGDGSGVLTLRNSTVSNNLIRTDGGPGGIQNISIDNGSATVEIANTIFNANVSGSIGSNGTVTSHGYNLSSDAAGGDGTTGPGGLLNGPGDIRNTNPLLGPLKNNGGPTLTHALLLHSPAIDAGDPSFNPYGFNPPLLYDQRGPGFPRIVNGRVDIGAFESKYRHP